MRTVLLLLLIGLMAPTAGFAQQAQTRAVSQASSIAVAVVHAPSGASLHQEWRSAPLEDRSFIAEDGRLSPAARGALIGGGVGTLIGAVVYFAQDDLRNEFWPFLLGGSVLANASLGALGGATVAWVLTPR